MLVEFQGEKTQAKTGCIPCGKRRVSSLKFERSKRIVLPSGRVVLFTFGRTEEVSKDDGEFLLELTYQLDGKNIAMFKEV